MSAVATVSRRCSVEYDLIATSTGAETCEARGAGGSRTATTKFVIIEIDSSVTM